MEGKRAVFFEVEPWEQEFFRDKLAHHFDLTFYPHRLTLDEVDEAAPANYLVCFIYSDLSSRLLDHLKHLKGISTMSVGADHIDLEQTETRHIVVSNVPAYGPNTVAEHTIALLLALSRNIVTSVERTREGVYEYQGLTGWDLQGKTIGVIGTGKIGSLVVKMAIGLGMKVVAYDPKPNQKLALELGFEYANLPQLLRHSQVITLHVPLTAANKHMLGRPEFAQMTKGVVILNTARGALIEADALLEALDTGIVKQAGIDVLEDEGLLKEEKEFFSPYFKLNDYQTALANHALMRHPKVLVTPHNAFNSQESLKNILQTTVENLQAMAQGEPINTVGER